MPRWLGAFSQYEQALLAYAAMVNAEVDKCEPLPTTEGGDDT